MRRGTWTWCNPAGAPALLMVWLATCLLASAAEDCSDCFDDDGDGLVDCYDPECWAGGDCVGTYIDTTPPSVECGGEVQLTELWRVQVHDASLRQPTVGDVDGDGMPEVVIRALGQAVFVLDGATGAIELETEPTGVPSGAGAVSIADVDEDGTGEMFFGRTPGQSDGYHLVRYEHDGSRTYDVGDYASIDRSFVSAPAFADFDADGIPEVFELGLIFDSRDGSVLVDALEDLLWGRRTDHTLAADMFPDEACDICSGLELVAAHGVWAVDVQTGAFERLAARDSGLLVGVLAVVDWNGDGELDIVSSVREPGWGSSRTAVWDPRLEIDLTPTVTLEGPSGSVPLVADLDGDLELEIVLLEWPNPHPDSDRSLLALDHDMSVMWETQVEEDSDWTSPVAFDFNADGLPEIVHRGGVFLTIFDGSTGERLAEEPCRSSTSGERATIVDVDADGRTDIVIGCGSELVAFTVNESQASRQVDNQYQYHVYNVNDDLTIPCKQQDHAAPNAPSWLNASLSQAALASGGRTLAEECRCGVPPTAVLVEQDPICFGEPMVLDASASAGCSMGRRYRFVDEWGAIVCDWSADPTCAVVAGASRRYIVTVACEEDTWCHHRVSGVVNFSASPIAEAGNDLVSCPGEEVPLVGDITTPCGCSEVEYQWSDEGGVLRAHDAEPDFVVFPTTDTTYTLETRCVGDSSGSSDTVRVIMRADPVGSSVGAALRAVRTAEADVDFEWCSARALGPDEHVHVYRATEADGPFTLVAPEPHLRDFRQCSWTDFEAPDALCFYDVRFSTCAEELTPSPWRGLP